MAKERRSVSQAIKDKVIIDWRIGELSQRKIAEKYGISHAYVAKLTDGISRDCEQLVSTGVEYRQGLAKHDEKLVSAIERTVITKAALLETLNHYAMENANQAMQMTTDNMRDLNQRAEIILKTKETVAGKQPETAIQINQAQQPTEINLIGVE